MEKSRGGGGGKKKKKERKKWWWGEKDRVQPRDSAGQQNIYSDKTKQATQAGHLAIKQPWGL